MARIKGFAIRGLLRYAKEYEPGSIRPLIESLSAEIREVFVRPITISQLYPYEAFSELLRAIDRRFGRGDLSLCAKIGEISAERDINGIFKAALGLFGPKILLRRANILWSKYCDTGRFVPIDISDHSFLQRLEGFPEIDEAQCRLLDGFMRKFGKLVTGFEVEMRHTTCVHHGGEFCEWQGTWHG